MSKLILLSVLSTIVFFSTAANVAAQNLVTRENGISRSEVDKLIKFYEWAFETEFTPAERETYRHLVDENFRQSPGNTRRYTDALLSVLEKVLTKDAEAQAKIRTVFNEETVKELRTSNDEGSRMLLGVFERGRRNTGSADASDTQASNDAPRPIGTDSSNTGTGTGSQSLVGSWTRSDGTGGATDGTGKTRYNSGTDTTFEFRADGSMLFTVKQETLSITQCRISESTRIPGRYTISGGQLTMNLGTGTNIGKSSCDAKDNFNKTLSASSVTKTFVVKRLESVFRPDAPLILCLDGQDGDACFERTNKQ